jgi:DNA-binding NarL/FixJ family response regulator
MAAIKVFVIDDQRLVREAIVHTLTSCGFAVVGEAGNGTAAMERIPQADPDVAVVDLGMPGASGIEVTRWIREHHARTEVVLLTGFHNEAYEREGFEAGARAYAVKDAPFEQLVQAIRAAANGDYYAAGTAGHEAASEYAQPWVARQNPGGIITRRERELAILLADGYSSKEAAAILHISVRTAETHRATLMHKLGARNVSDIVKYCIRNRLIGV